MVLKLINLKHKRMHLVVNNIPDRGPLDLVVPSLLDPSAHCFVEEDFAHQR